jgi:hypothetical protein
MSNETQSNKTNEEVVQELVTKCLRETKLAHTEKYDPEKAELTAAMFLEARMQLSTFIEDVELRAKQAKTDVGRVEGEKYFFYKNQASEKKTTDAALAHLIAKDEDVIESKSVVASAESEYKKWVYLMETLKDGHHFFKMVGKGKSAWE